MNIFRTNEPDIDPERGHKRSKYESSRMLNHKLGEYIYDDCFLLVATKLYKDKHIDEEIAVAVARLVWRELQSHDVRMLKHIRNLIKKNDTPESIEKFVKQIIDMHEVEQTEFN